MQLRLAFSVPKFTGSLFKQSTSAILTGVTIAGALATVIFNSTSTRGKVTDAFQTFAKLLSDTPIYSGAEKLAGTFKDWGTTLVSKKDDFKEWVYQYLNPEGFKSGAVELYTKLYDWATIVYEWFRDKFLKFISNIPKMVENWKQLRLSLFKWGTFLGGGGGSALWAMFGNGDNWGKLAELIGNPEYEGLLEKFSTLVEKNGDAFAGMTTEEAQEMLEGILDDPEEANKMLDELEKDREEKNKKHEEELKEKKEEKKEELELDKNEILEKLGKPKGGKPKTPTEALGGFMSAGLKAIKDLPATENTFEKAKLALEDHIKTLEKESTGSSKIAQIKKNFVDALKDGNAKDQLVRSFAGLMVRAHSSYKSIGSQDSKVFDAMFKNLVREEFTKEAGAGEEGNAQGLDELNIKSS